MMHDSSLIAEARAQFEAPYREANETQRALDQAEKFTVRAAAVAIALVVLAFAIPAVLAAARGAL